MIRKAAEFAAKAHEGAVRKGSRIPYIYHPMEAAVIVAQMTEDEEVIAAAYLHDVLEDTAVTAEQLEEEFGGRVLALVSAETEDKSLSWRERKQAAIEHLKTASREEKILVLGDSLAICEARPGIIWQKENRCGSALMKNAGSAISGIWPECWRD